MYILYDPPPPGCVLSQDPAGGKRGVSTQLCGIRNQMAFKLMKTYVFNLKKNIVSVTSRCRRKTK